jgi:6-phosphogluconolactonase (cycloisomerase 2 family)
MLWGCGGGGGGGGSTPAATYHAYVTNISDQTLSVFEMNPATGGMTKLTDYAMEDDAYPLAIVAHPTLDILYVTTTDRKIRVLEVDPATGTPAEVQSINSVGVARIDITPDGNYLFTSNLADELGADDARKIYSYTVDSDGTLASSDEKDLGQRISYFKVGHDSTALFVTFRNNAPNNNLICSYSIDPPTGNLTFLNSEELGNSPGMIAISGEYTYAAATASGDIWRTEDASDLGDKRVIYATCGTSQAITIVGSHLYGVNLGNDTITEFTISQTDGTLTEGTGVAIPAGSQIWQINADPDGKFLYVFDWLTSDMTGYRINATTGALTSLGSVGTTGGGPMQMAFIKH